jgi:hypothetical protein
MGWPLLDFPTTRRVLQFAAAAAQIDDRGPIDGDISWR